MLTLTPDNPKPNSLTSLPGPCESEGKEEEGITGVLLWEIIVKFVQPARHGETYSVPSSPHTGMYTESEHEQLARHVDKDL